jgi:predicted TIM-barrel fold metal-dependent hydrolase
MGLNAPTAGSDRFDTFTEWHTVVHPHEAQCALLSMIVQGVYERFPRLRVAYMEAGCGWLPSWIERADGKFEMFGFTTGLKHKPSELLLRNCWISAEPDEDCIPAIAGQIGARRLLWATDYPHIDAYKNPLAELREKIASMPPVDQEWILGKSAVELYRL